MSMRVFSARVRRGAIVPDNKLTLPEGTVVTVITDAKEETFETTAEEEARLLEAIAEAERGEVVSAADLLDRLPR